ncbi:MAG TPA: YihY/virulence factor BrkB family protein [Candidatus Saccharimonadales bacterium]|nr:YihY/virulence factor BrkB family protein [Candidatus Saccharimonadales bacterium]
MNPAGIIRKIDRWQQKHPVVALPYALFKKYGEDSGGFHAALLTYYGFLSLFPLLLVLVTILQLWFRNDTAFQQQISTSVGHFFPLLGDQLQHNIHGIRGAGIGLVIGILFTLYGARGAADAFRFAVDNMWQIPKNKRAGFPKNIMHSLAIMAAGTAGFGATVAISAFSADLGRAQWTKILANVLGFAIVTLVLGYTIRIATGGRLRLRYMLLGAGIAATLIQLLLSFGGILVAHQLHNLSAVYGTFAVVLGMLFWIYLLSQIVLLGVEVDTVRHFKLYPRSITGGTLQTEADRYAYRLYAKTEKYVPNETIKAKFKR